MKLITAIIRGIKLEEVREALFHEGIQGLTVELVSGHGKQTTEEYFRGKKIVPSLIPKVKLQILAKDEMVDRIVDTITRSAKSNLKGEIGDGKIWITSVEDCIRIRTGERGPESLYIKE